MIFSSSKEIAQTQNPARAKAEISIRNAFRSSFASSVICSAVVGVSTYVGVKNKSPEAIVPAVAAAVAPRFSLKQAAKNAELAVQTYAATLDDPQNPNIKQKLVIRDGELHPVSQNQADEPHDMRALGNLGNALISCASASQGLLAAEWNVNPKAAFTASLLTVAPMYVGGGILASPGNQAQPYIDRLGNVEGPAAPVVSIHQAAA